MLTRVARSGPSWIQTAGTILLLLVATTAAAQTSWRLEVTNGLVKVNGETVESADLPMSFDVSTDFRLHFNGPDTMVVAIGDAFYVLRENGLREVSPVEVQRYGLPNLTLYNSFLNRADYISEANDALVKQLTAFSEQMKRDQVQEQYLREAQKAAAAAAVLPHLEMQSYWSGMRDENAELYRQHLEEHNMDLRANELAQAYRLAPPGDRRDAIERELREVLNQSFDLKQNNRRNEIDQLEMRLEDLQRRMEERKKHRDLIIDKRVNELLGRTSQDN